MKRGQKWALGLGIAAVALGMAWLAVIWWLPSDGELAARFTAEAEDQLGVKVTIGSVRWALLPKPVVVVSGFRTVQPQPMVIGTLSAHLNAHELLRRKFVFERLEIDDAVLPRRSVVAFRLKADKNEPEADDSVPLEHFEFRNLTWISNTGIAVAYDGDVDFDAHWRPRKAELRRPGIGSFTLTLTRDGTADRWQARIRVGGGTADGMVALTSTPNGAMHLSGRLAPHDIEVANALSTFNRRSYVEGKASGQTTVSADGKSASELARSLHTSTMFSFTPPATMPRFDLDKAIKTRGKDYHGQTTLQELTGQMDTQNTEEGMRVTYTGLEASAGLYTFTGQATIYNRQVAASGTLDIVEGAIGVPFAVSGSVDTLVVSVPPGFLAGVAVGTAVLPGIGTVVGARVGSVLGRIFNGSALQPVTPADTQKKN